MELQLLAAIRETRQHQYQVAEKAGMRESRLSRIVRHGGATAEERATLSAALGIEERRLFSLVEPAAANDLPPNPAQ